MRNKGPYWRGVLRRAIETAFSFQPFVSYFERRAQGRCVVLAYHNVIPDDEPISGDPGAHLRMSDFCGQLDILSETAQVVALEDLFPLEPIKDSLRVAITFDDAYRGTLLLGLPELVRRKVPATVFVPTGLIGTKAFWWDEFEFSGWEGDRIPLRRLRGHYPAVRDWALENGWTPRDQGPFQVPCTEDELVGAAGRSEGIRFGSHTVSHPNLSQLSSEEIRGELTSSLAWLVERNLPTSQWLSYPYGLASPKVEDIARQCGLAGALTITGGPILPPLENPFRVPRVNIPARTSRQGFLLRLLGLTG